MKTSDTLKAALQLLKTKGWTQGYYARTKAGNPIGTRDASATCFCAAGALLATTRPSSLPNLDAAERVLDQVVRARGFKGFVTYNDDPRCEFRHIRALFGKAIKMCEEKGE